MVTKEQVRSLKMKYADALLSLPGVIGVGSVGSGRPDNLCLCIWVEAEAVKELLEALIVKEIDGVPVEFLNIKDRIVPLKMD